MDFDYVTSGRPYEIVFELFLSNKIQSLSFRHRGIWRQSEKVLHLSRVDTITEHHDCSVMEVLYERFQILLAVKW
jgi:hypothetical protein